MKLTYGKFLVAVLDMSIGVCIGYVIGYFFWGFK